MNDLPDGIFWLYIYIPEYANHLGQASLGGFLRLFAHAEHLNGTLPSTRAQWLWHGSLQQSEI